MTHHRHQRLEILENIPLAPYTTLDVGGPARYFARATAEAHIPEAVEFTHRQRCPLFILGGGSNIVVADSGFPGLVLKMEIGGIRRESRAADPQMSAGAGVAWDDFVNNCVGENLAGVECLSGIPGTVGAVPIQNVGAYGQEVGDTLAWIRAWDRQTDTICIINGGDCGFGYRSSRFNAAERDRYIITEAGFALRSEPTGAVRYPDLQRLFADTRYTPAVGAVRRAVIELRRAKAMIHDPNDRNSKSAGSFFRNPLLSPKEFEKMEKDARSERRLTDSESIPQFAAADGKIKIPAAWLIEAAGFPKGFVQGKAGISARHALAIVNRGGATAEDILDLMHRIQQRVLDVFGIDLRPEPIFVGFERQLI